jgi:hypothetical protein
LGNWLHSKTFICDCSSLQELSTSINQLNALQSFHLQCCWRLK